MTGVARRLGVPVLAALLATACAPVVTPSAHAVLLGGLGLVVGGVEPCSGLPPLPGEQFAAATVSVLEGTVTRQSTGPGSWTLVLPSVVSAQESVARNALYRFSLAPGDYVLVAHFPPPANVVPVVSVTVTAGTTATVNIPNSCK
jgi:hypothetical protein